MALAGQFKQKDISRPMFTKTQYQIEARCGIKY